MVRLVLSIFILLIVSSNVFAGVKVNVTLSKKEIRVGDEITVTYKADSALCKEILLPQKKIYSMKDFAKKEEKPVKDADKDETDDMPLLVIDSVSSKIEGNNRIADVVVRFYSPGRFMIPFAMVEGNDGKPVQYDPSEINVKVTNTQGKQEEIEDPVFLSGNYTRLIWLIAGLTLLIAAAIIGYIFYKKRKARRAFVGQPAEDPIGAFRDKIRSVENDLLNDSINAEQYCDEMTIAFRSLAAKKYSINALEMANREFIDALLQKRKGLAREKFEDELEQVTMLWEIARFAEFVPSKELLVENLRRASALAEKLWR